MELGPHHLGRFSGLRARRRWLALATTLLLPGEAPSRVVSARDPTAHAEMEAIRDAAR